MSSLSIATLYSPGPGRIPRSPALSTWIIQNGPWAQAARALPAPWLGLRVKMSLTTRFGWEIPEMITGQLALLPAPEKYLVFTLTYLKGCFLLKRWTCEKHPCPDQKPLIICSQKSTLHMGIVSHLCQELPQFSSLYYTLPIPIASARPRRGRNCRMQRCLCWQAGKTLE